MKKHFKLILTAILIFSFVFSLCGCKQLDNLKQKQAFSQPDGSIIFNNKKFVMFGSAYDYENFDFSGYLQINVTSPDVPVLLSGTYSSINVLGYNKKYIIMEDYTIYCREDYIDELKQIIAKNEMPYYYAVDPNNYMTYENFYEKILFKQSEQEKIKQILNSKKYKDKKTLSNIAYNYDINAEIGVCSKDFVLTKQNLTVILYNENMYIMPLEAFYSYGSVDENGHSNFDPNIYYYYKVPKNCEYIFNSLLY